MLRSSRRKSPKLIQAAHRLAHRSIGKAQFGGYRQYRELQAKLADDERMAEQMGIDGAIENGQAEARGENILKLHPEESRVQFFAGIHVQILKKGKEMGKAESTPPSKMAVENYFMLDAIITDAKNNTTLNLSRNSKTTVDVFRTLGNFSADKIEYICRREYLKEHILAFRALVSELLHKSGIRV